MSAQNTTAPHFPSLDAPPSVSRPLREFWLKLVDRSQRLFDILDDALESDNFKERVWAVELLLKKLSPDKELMAELQALLQEEWESASDMEIALRTGKRPAQAPVSDEEILVELDALFNEPQAKPKAS